MQGKSLIHRWRFTGFGAVLCLLAAVFSFEAKIAWYSAAPRANGRSAPPNCSRPKPPDSSSTLGAQLSAPRLI